MREQFTTMMKDAMKAGDKRRLATVRMIQAALKDKDIEARGAGKTVSDDDILAMLQKMVKSAPGIGRHLRQGGTSRARAAGARGNRHHQRVPAEANVGRRR